MGKEAKIIDKGGVYPTYMLKNKETDNKEIQLKANENEWEKTNFIPLNGMIGEVVEEFNHVDNKRLVYILKIEGTHYVPVDERYIEFFDKQKEIDVEKESATVELKNLKEKLDLELISREEYDEHKNRLGSLIMGNKPENFYYENWLEKAKEELDIEYSNKKLYLEERETQKKRSKEIQEKIKKRNAPKPKPAGYNYNSVGCFIVCLILLIIYTFLLLS